MIGLTALGIGLALVDPALAGSTRPHPTLTGSVGDAAGILQNNPRVLARPVPARRCSASPRAASVAMPATSSSRPSLPPARSRSGSSSAAGKADCCLTCRSCHSNGRRSPSPSHAWLHRPTGTAARPRLIACSPASSLALLICAAAPRDLGHAAPHAGAPSSDQAARVRDTAVWATGGLPSPGFCAGPGRVASRSRAPFPSLRSVPLGRLAGADRAHINQPTPTRRDHMAASIVNLIGRLTQDPGAHHRRRKHAVGKLRIAVQRPAARTARTRAPTTST